MKHKHSPAGICSSDIQKKRVWSYLGMTIYLDGDLFTASLCVLKLKI